MVVCNYLVKRDSDMEKSVSKREKKTRMKMTGENYKGKWIAQGNSTVSLIASL
jgi:hypothetical protein